MYMGYDQFAVGIEEYMSAFVPHFRRSEGFGLASSYVVGLTIEGERKSVEPMSEKVNASERGMQRLLSEVKWDNEGVYREYRKLLLDQTADPLGVLAVDDTGFPKKGRHSVCVARQYCGSLGKVDNCQIGVSLTYVGQGFSWPYAMHLYIPKSWDSPDIAWFREKTKMPETAHYREKWQIALEQIDVARAENVPHRAVVADSWYGSVPDFRRALDDRSEKYVVGVYANTEVFLEGPVFDEPVTGNRGRPRTCPRLSDTNPPPVKVSELIEKIDEWEHLELRSNSKGKPLIVEAVSRRAWPAQGYRKGIRHEEVWLIIERRKEKSGFDYRFFFSNMPQDMPTIELVRLYHERSWIEQGYQQLKEELGLDHHEGRSWIGWHRHVLLVFLAFGYLTLLRIHEKKRYQERQWT